MFTLRFIPVSESPTRTIIAVLFTETPYEKQHQRLQRHTKTKTLFFYNCNQFLYAHTLHTQLIENVQSAYHKYS